MVFETWLDVSSITNPKFEFKVKTLAHDRYLSKGINEASPSTQKKRGQDVVGQQ